jgi:hypothetical protein
MRGEASRAEVRPCKSGCVSQARKSGVTGWGVGALYKAGLVGAQRRRFGIHRDTATTLRRLALSRLRS